MIDMSDCEVLINPAGYNDAYLAAVVWGTLRLSSIRFHRIGQATTQNVQAVIDRDGTGAQWCNVALILFPEDTSDEDMDRIAEDVLALCKLRWGVLT